MKGIRNMGSLLQWAIVLIVIAVIAAFFGMGGVAGTAASGAQLLIYGAVALLVVGALVALVRRA
jgi:MYXO-CTERM domain-containing protein